MTIPANTLRLTLHREFFAAILAGAKTEEYREAKEYWTRRLNRSYNYILFRNGYAGDAPEMLVELKGIECDFNALRYTLSLGAIIETRNCERFEEVKEWRP